MWKYTEDHLKTWGYEDLISTFREKNLTLDILEVLTPNELRDLIPDVARRASFWRNFQSWNEDFRKMEKSQHSSPLVNFRAIAKPEFYDLDASVSPIIETSKLSMLEGMIRSGPSTSSIPDADAGSGSMPLETLDTAHKNDNTALEDILESSTDQQEGKALLVQSKALRKFINEILAAVVLRDEINMAECALLLVPNLIKLTPVKKRKGLATVWHPSWSETADGFVTCIKSSGELLESMQVHREKLANLKVTGHFYCFNCKFPFFSVKSLIFHIKKECRIQPWWKQNSRCGQAGCYRSYTNIESFRKHLNITHADHTSSASTST